MADPLGEGDVTATMALFSDALRSSHAAELDGRLEAARKAEAARAQTAEKIDSALEALVDEVCEGFRDKVTKAVEAGQKSTEIFVFAGDDRFDDEYSYLFLVNGPKRARRDYFDKLYVMPFMARLYRRVRPFEPSLTYIPEANENIVTLTWRSRC